MQCVQVFLGLGSQVCPLKCICYADISVHEYVNLTGVCAHIEQGVSVGSLSLSLGREPGTFNFEGL